MRKKLLTVISIIVILFMNFLVSEIYADEEYGGSTDSQTSVQYYNSNGTTSDVTFSAATNGFTRRGYSFVKWADGDAPTTLYAETQSIIYNPQYDSSTLVKIMFATWQANELTFENQTITKSYSTSQQTANVTAATNGTGLYIYTKKSGESDITVSPTGVITIPAGKTAGTYTVVITATDSNSNAHKDATYTININKVAATNSVTITGTNTYGKTLTASVTTNSDGAKTYQWWSATSATATSGTAIEGATNATYTIGTGLVGKYIGVTVNIAAGTNWNAAAASNDITDSTNGTATVAKATPTITFNPTATSAEINYNESKTFKAKSNVAGTLSATSASSTYVSITGGASNNATANTEYTITYKGARYRASATNITVKIVPTDTANWNEATKTFSVTKVNKLTVGAPSNLSVSTAGIVTWTAGTNSNAHEISIDNSTWTTATSGVNYLSTITAATGSRTVYVRAKNTDTTNYTTPSSNATKAVTVRTLTTSSNNTNYGTVDSSTYNVISGVTFATSNNTLVVKSGTTTLKTITATKIDATGYTTTFSSWSSTSGTISANRTITANFTRTTNTYKIRFNGNGSTSGSMSDLPMTYGTAKNLTANAYAKTGKGFAGWATSATATTATYTDGQEVNNLTTTNGAVVNLYAVWADAELLSGSNFNIKIKQLAGNTGSVSYTTQDTNITEFRKSATKPTAANMTSNNLISSSSSKVPVYAWFDNGTIYWWSEDATPLCNVYSSYMFYGCQGLTSLDVSAFNTANVTIMYGMFGGCRSLTSLNLSNFNTSQVTNMSDMFYDCRGLTSLDLTSFNTSQVTNMYWMFTACNSLTSLDISSFNTEQVTNMGNMFSSCSSLTSLNVSGFNTAKVTNMGSMFSGCRSLTSLNVSSFNTEQVTDMDYMFYYCSSLTSLDVSNFNTANVVHMEKMFSNCSGLTSLNLSNFNTAQVINMEDLFRCCTGLTSINLSSFNTAQVTKMDYMFEACINLTNLDVSNFNTAKVTSMRGMFDSCINLTYLDVSSFNTAKVTDMIVMFAYCSSLTSLDLSSFNTAQVTKADSMFENSTALTTIYATDNFVTTNLTYSGRMFESVTNIVGGNGTVFNSSYTDKTYARIDRSGTPGYFTGRFTITLDSSDATAAGTQTIYETQGEKYSLTLTGDAITSITKPIKTGYNFKGYYTEADGAGTKCIDKNGNIIVGNRQFTENTTLYAYFAKEYTIRFNGNGATSGSMSDLPMVYGTAKNLTANAFAKEGKGFAGWATSATATTATYTDGQEVNNLTTTNGATVNLYAVWADAELLSGRNFNIKIKQLAGNTGSVTVETADTNITQFIRSETKPTAENMTSNNLISLNTSKVPVYAWFDNGTIYWWSEDTTPLCNADSSNMFYRCRGLTSLDLSSFDTAKVNIMASMFCYCGGLTSLNLSNFNTAQVTNMQKMFYGCSSLTSLDLSNFDTAKVTQMYYMFRDCSSLTSLDVSSFNTEQVKSMVSMFNGCSSLTSLDVSNFNTVKVTDMEGMFAECSGLTSINVSNFNTANVTEMNGMFAECSGLTSINVSNFNTANVTLMNSMFEGCSSLTSLDLSNFNTAQVTDMSMMFKESTKLTSLNIGNFNTINVTYMNSMFYDCSSLTSLDLSGFNSTNVTDMAFMFFGCKDITTIYATDNFVTTSVTSDYSMFSYDTNLVGGNGTAFGAYNDKTYARIDRANVPGYFTLKGVHKITLDNQSATSAGTPAIYETYGSQYSLSHGGSAATTITKPTRTGYTFGGYYTATGGGGTQCINASGTITASNTKFTQPTTLYAKWTANPLTFANQTITKDYSTSAQTANITAASNGTGTYTYTEKSEKNSAGTATNYISISGTTINIAANTPAGKYTYVITAKDSNSNVTKDATYTITINKVAATNSVTITGTATYGQTLTANVTTNSDGAKTYQWWYSTSATATGGTSISGATSATYTIADAGSTNLVGKYIGVRVNIAAGTNWKAASAATDITDSTNGTASVICTYTIKFNGNGSTSGNMSDLSMTYGTAKNLTANAFAKTGKIFIGWSKNSTATNATYTDGQEVNNLTTTQGEIVNLYAVWADAQLDTGNNFNKKLKQLSGDTGTVSTNTENTSITQFKRSQTPPTSQNMTSNNLISLSTSKVPIYAWFNNGTIYWWSEDTTPLLNQSCERMFENFQGLTSLDLSDFDSTQVLYMSCMFDKCSSLTSLNLSNFDTSRVDTMYWMFKECSSLTSLNLSSFNTSNVYNMSGMFSNCSSLTSLNLSNFNTSNVTHMEDMFSGCSSLTSLNVSSFNTAQVTNMSNMFINCSSLTGLNLSHFNTANVTNMYEMFFNCRGLTSLNISNFDTTKVTNMSSMFYHCSSLTSLNVSSFNTANVTNMYMMFEYCDNLTSLNLSNFNTSNVTSMGYMFCYCRELTSLNVSSFNTANVTGMQGMFRECKKLTSLNVSSFNTANVTDMSSMFYQCEGLTSLDLSNFNTANVTKMSSMFWNCISLKTIYATNAFVTTNVTNTSDGDYMFAYCKVLVGGNGTVYSFSHKNKEYARIDRSGTPGYFTLK